MELVISLDDLSTVEDQGTVVLMTGTRPKGRERVCFAGDHRVMGGLLEYVSTQGEVTVEIEEWQILGHWTPEREAS